MRDIILFIAFFGLVPGVLWRPYVGILLWVWLAVMNPQTLAGGDSALPLGPIVGAITFVAWLFSREPKRPPWDAVVILLVVYIAWATLTTVLALYQDGAWFLWDRFVKIQASNFLLLLMLTSRLRIDALIWTICLSLGYFITRDGLFTLATGGRHLTYGPAGSEIAGNNEFGVALLMALPLLFYLAQTAPWRWLHFGIFAEIALAVVSTIATYSRGAFAGLAVLGGLSLLRSRQKAAVLLIAAVLGIAAFQFFPDYWARRVQSIGNFNSDASVEGRFQAWTHAIHVAMARPLIGGGMGAFSLPVFEEYSPGLPNRAAHSIYFQTLGEQGFVGLALFLALMAAGARNCLAAMQRARGRPDLAWVATLGRSLLFAMVGYATAGAFVSLANLDLYYMILALTVALQRVAGMAEAAAEPAPSPPAGLPDPAPAGQ
jgi:probable O-glycosylation ligase (exosortase A-associated)